MVIWIGFVRAPANRSRNELRYVLKQAGFGVEVGSHKLVAVLTFSPLFHIQRRINNVNPPKPFQSIAPKFRLLNEHQF